MPLLALVFLSAVLSSPQRVWNDSIRDVYVDGRLDRSAQTLTSSSPRLIAVVCGDEVLMFDPEARAVARAPKSALAFAADRTTATSAEIERASGDVVRVDDRTILARVDGRTLLIAAHQSKAGPMTIEELYATAPVWRSVADVYEPDAAVLERLRAIDAPVTLQVVLATWCGDSRQHVPRLLKAVERAANPHITVELTGIGPDFESPMKTIVSENITNVPTVIVRRGGSEIGRVVETPAGATIEGDIADIVGGTPKVHPSRYERGPLLASGTYVLRDARRRIRGTERFELYERPGGGVVAHSVIGRRDGTSTETWTAVDAEKKPRLLEVTHRAATTTRTRFRRSGESWSATSRGASGGIVQQNVYAPEAFVAPATITYAWARGASSVYAVPESGVGTTQTLDVRVSEEEIPRTVRFADGSTRTLVECGNASCRSSLRQR